MPSAARNPTSWDEYEGHASPSNSLTSSVLREEQALVDDDGEGLGAPLGRRRSSVTNRLTAMADIGGVNSFRSFARSWQRAADFTEVIPRRPSFILSQNQDGLAFDSHESLQYGRSLVDPGRSLPQAGLLGQHLNAESPQDGGRLNGESSDSFGSLGRDSVREDFRDRESKALDSELENGALLGTSPSRSSIFAIPPHLTTPEIVGSYGSASGYGAIGGSLCHRSSTTRLPSDWEDEVEDTNAHGEHQPILVKKVQQGDKVVLAVEGQSTMPQSVFNNINVIVGIGLLSLPLAFNRSGWIIGFLLLTFIATVTAYTAKLLSKCIDIDPSLITYSDLAYVSFGSRARIVVSMLFTLELLAACVALIILFSDTLDLLLPGVANATFWKAIAAILTLVLNALPLRLLSYTSVIGIFSTICIVLIVIANGLIKEHTPGSLREPAKTYLLPNSWMALLLAYGLLASPWGAHSVFPSIYRDMRHPYKWSKAVNITFSFAYGLSTLLAVIGLLMFGDGIRNAITSNVLKTPGYPPALTILMCIFITIVPLTKLPLNTRPIITTVDVLCGVHHDHHGNLPPNRRSAFFTSCIKGVVRVFVVLILLLISIVFPAFDSICAFLGAALCTLIAVILPITFYMKLFWTDIPAHERVLLIALLVIFSIFGTLGTIWTFLPKHLIGVD